MEIFVLILLALGLVVLVSAIRIVEIDGIDRQPCGGTHVRATGEIGRATVTKIEKKSRQNRRVVVALADEIRSTP